MVSLQTIGGIVIKVLKLVRRFSYRNREKCIFNTKKERIPWTNDDISHNNDITFLSLILTNSNKVLLGIN